MNKFLLFTATCASFGGVTHAANAAGENLTRLPLCLTSNAVQIDQDLRAIAPNIGNELRTRMVNKLTAYRVKFSPACGPNSFEIWTQIDIIKGNSAIPYTIDIDLYGNVLSLPQFISAYNLSSFGTTIETTPTGLTDRFWSILSELIDKLAADYATANP